VIAGLTRAVPILRRVISFDPAAGDMTLFGDLLADPPTRFVYPFNLTQQPAISLPCGMTSQGLPVSLQIVGPRRG
jgi:Asp-tRNA(Asn)/Glu-tRNA(Gln) amidotransferase A subunit family amidase